MNAGWEDRDQSCWSGQRDGLAAAGWDSGYKFRSDHQYW